MRISSSAFEHNTSIPAKYTCQGEDISPPLKIKDIPDKTESLVLIMDDPDAPNGTWDHWVVFNIHPVNEIKEGESPGYEGKNSWGKNMYGGPCPPSGTHRYFFKVYALDCKLTLDPSATKKDVESHMEGHVLESAELIGLYQKS